MTPMDNNKNYENKNNTCTELDASKINGSVK